MSAKRILIFLLIILLLAIVSIYYPKLTGEAAQQTKYTKEIAILSRAIDGDTIEAQVKGETWKIRLLGINTPEKNMPYSNYASDYLKKLENKSIFLERDSEDEDKYQRKLRYLYLDNQLINLYILEKGWANTYYLEDLKYKEKLANAEKQARIQELGIWKRSQELCFSCIILENLDAKAESFILKNTCNFDCNLTRWFVKDAGRNLIKLSPIKSQQQLAFFSAKEIWNNDGDKFFLFDSQGYLVVYYEY